ncbi:MAG: hypothetical protein IH995_02650 [Proteobacteria bacterium]|nr:hypothetical protein [Pseudomonadota bacterium]
MKKFLKIAGVLFLGAIGIGLIWYFQSLKIDGEPLLTACWGVEVYDDLTGEKVVGVEDLDFDPATGTIFMSAYDRRAVAREIEAGKVTTQGGIYTINISDITEEGILKVTDISREFKEAGNEFRPHGFVFVPETYPEIIAINRLYSYSDSKLSVAPAFLGFELLDGNWVHTRQVILEGVCDPYDVLKTGAMLIPMMMFTDVTGKCEGGNYSQGVVKIYAGKKPDIVINDLSFPNGIVATRKFFAVAQTRDDSILIFESEDTEESKKIKLPIAPDNLTVDQDDNLYVAGFPNLIDYYFYMKSWMGVNKSPSAAYRISPETYEQTLLFKDNGSMISGATVALRAGDYLILGSGWDDNIAICSGMDGLD